MNKKLLKILLLIATFCVILTSCGTDEENNPKLNEEDKATIVGKWTIEDYRTGEYTTFEFNDNGEYTMLQPFYNRMDMAAGRYQYDPETQIISFEHFYQDYDFIEHGNDPDWGTHLNVRCILDGSILTMIGEDCEEFGLTSPVDFNKGAYSGVCPDFKSLLCTMGQYIKKEPEKYGMSEETMFEFYNNGRIDFSYIIIVKRNDGTQGYGKVYASGTFSVENYYLNCRFTTVSKEEYNFGLSSTSLWEQFTDGRSQIISFYLALDDSNKVIIKDSPLY